MKTCPKCGKALEMTQVVMGRVYTHPCACRCQIEEFERTHGGAGRRAHEIHGVREADGESKAEGGRQACVHPGPHARV